MGKLSFWLQLWNSLWINFNLLRYQEPVRNEARCLFLKTPFAKSLCERLTGRSSSLPLHTFSTFQHHLLSFQTYFTGQILLFCFHYVQQLCVYVTRGVSMRTRPGCSGNYPPPVLISSISSQLLEPAR